MFILGADIGQARDFTGFIVLDQRVRRKENAEPDLEGYFPAEALYHIRRIERPELGTPYPRIIDRICAILDHPKLAPNPVCAVDATGVGRPIVDALRERGANICPVTITGGDRVHFSADDGFWRVPKKELASTLQMLLQRGNIKQAARSADPIQQHLSDTLEREMLSFAIKVSATGNESYEAWRERDHDDLVLALALGLWLGERMRPARTDERVKPRPTGLEEALAEAQDERDRKWWQT